MKGTDRRYARKKWLTLLIALTLGVLTVCSLGVEAAAASAGNTKVAEEYAGAQGNAVIEVEEATAAPGEMVELAVNLTQNPGIATFGLAISYDSDALELKSIAKADLFSAGTFTSSVKDVYVQWYDQDSQENVTGTGKMFSMTFQVLEAASAGKHAVSLNFLMDDGDVADTDYEAVPVTFTAGSVTVKGKESEGKKAAIQAGSGEAAQGETVTIPVSITENPGITAFSLVISFNKDALELKSIEKGEMLSKGAFSSETVSDKPYAKWSAGNSENLIEGTGTLFQLTFQAAEDAALGTYPVEIGYKDSDGDVKDADGKKVTVGFTAGNIKVSEKNPGAIPPAQIVLAKQEVSLAIGEEYRISAQVLPENAGNKTLNYSSSDKTVAEVSEEGIVTGKKEGSAVITIKAAADQSVTAELTVTVKKSEERVLYYTDFYEDESLKTLLKKDFEAEEGESFFSIKYDVLPQEGYIGVASEGETISCRPVLFFWNEPEGFDDLKAGSSVELEAELSIKGSLPDGKAPSEIPAFKIRLTITELVPHGILIRPIYKEGLLPGGTYQLKAEVSPDNAVNKNVIWSSGNASVATVDDKGLVTAVAPGKVLITAVAEANKEAKKSTEIVVTEKTGDVCSLSVSVSELNMFVGDTVTVAAAVNAEGDYGLVWECDSEDVSIEPLPNNTCKVTALDSTWALLNVYAYGGGGGVSASKRIEILVDSSEVSIEDEEYAQDGIWIAGLNPMTYTGQAVTLPDLHVYDGKRMLKEGKDYTLKYANNKDAGAKKQPSVTVKFMGSYKGSVTRTFVIEPFDISQDESGIKAHSASAVFKAGMKFPAPTVEWNGTKLKANKDYSVAY
ncbi:MAG: Ig-like domain-containing protein, partial [Lachnospiraceae bacterium]|nr:Ig-like domain-containing protein [Lachnospiraceae bacterium]